MRTPANRQQTEKQTGPSASTMRSSFILIPSHLRLISVSCPSGDAGADVSVVWTRIRETASASLEGSETAASLGIWEMERLFCHTEFSILCLFVLFSIFLHLFLHPSIRRPLWSFQLIWGPHGDRLRVFDVIHIPTFFQVHIST